MHVQGLGALDNALVRSVAVKEVWPSRS